MINDEFALKDVIDGARVLRDSDDRPVEPEVGQVWDHGGELKEEAPGQQYVVVGSVSGSPGYRFTVFRGGFHAAPCVLARWGVGVWSSRTASG